MLLRISVSALILFSILFWPFWLSVILALVAMVYFPIFFEACVLFLLSDVLYGVSEAKFYGMVFVSFFISIVVLLLVEKLKRNSNFVFQEKQKR
jgi:hypothetical protein